MQMGIIGLKELQDVKNHNPFSMTNITEAGTLSLS